MGQQLDRATFAALQKQGILDGLEMVNGSDPATAEIAPTEAKPCLGFSPIYMEARMNIEKEFMEDFQRHLGETSASETGKGIPR